MELNQQERFAVDNATFTLINGAGSVQFIGKSDAKRIDWSKISQNVFHQVWVIDDNLMEICLDLSEKGISSDTIWRIIYLARG